jgi:adenylate cyclase
MPPTLLAGRSSTPPAAVPETLEDALAAERMRNSRRGALLRLVAISAFFIFIFVFGVVLGVPTYRPVVDVFAFYWVVAVAFVAVTRYAPQWRRINGLGIPFLDMPMAFLTVWLTFPALPRDHPDGPATFLVALYALLIVNSGLTLERWQTLLTAGVGTVLAVVIQYLAGAPVEVWVLCALVLGLVAGTTLYAAERARALVVDVAGAELRRARLSRYFSPQIASLVEARGEHAAGGESREVTVLFCDIRGFTALADRLSTEEVVATLNAFHSRMVDVLFAHGGTLDKYMGDGLMAYFGAPLAQPDHAERAVRCALAMGEALVRLNAERARPDTPSLSIGIGIHSGRAIVGDIGSPHRREYTAVGDTVNVASRIEDLTKGGGATVLVSEATRAAVGERIRFADGGVAQIRGKAEAIRCYVPLAETGQLPGKPLG